MIMPIIHLKKNSKKFVNENTLNLMNMTRAYLQRIEDSLQIPTVNVMKTLRMEKNQTLLRNQMSPPYPNLHLNKVFPCLNNSFKAMTLRKLH